MAFLLSLRFLCGLRVSAVNRKLTRSHQIRTLPALAAAALLTTGCGYVGEPLPPLANVPARVKDLAAVQRGSRIMAQFTVPIQTTEGTPIKDPVKLDLRIGTGSEPFRADEWAAHARQVTPLPETAPGAGLAHYAIPAAEWTGKETILAVRLIGANGKAGGWSGFVILPVVPPPDQPADVTPMATADGVRLTWRARGENFQIFRKAQGETFTPVAKVQQPQWTDANAEFGKPYAYQVQTIVKLAGNKEAESDLSAEASITPVDTFPPAAPSGLRPSPAVNSIELAWDRNNESDLAGYRIYRTTVTAAAAAPLEKLADIGQIPSYSDRNVEHGKTYRYALSAIDRAGNESPKTPPVEVLLP
jgi:hypothetical protein